MGPHADIRLYGSPAARALHAECPAFDLHADPLLWCRWVGYDLNRRHRPPLPGARFGGHVDVPRLVEGGVGTVFFGLVSIPGLDRNLNATCHDAIDRLEAAAAASQNRLRYVRTADDVERAAREGSIAALGGIEGAQCLHGDIEELDRLVARGVRYLGLVHLKSNECGTTSTLRGARSTAGLKPFGRDIVLRCQQLGVVVDLAHINKAGFMDACAISRKPVYVSHTGVSGVHPHWRNIDDEQLRAVAKLGGAVGIFFVAGYLGSDGIGAVVEHLIYVLRVAGEDTPAIGSDWDGFIRPTRGLEEACKLPLLTDALLARGLDERVIRKILRENALRVLRERETGPSKPGQLDPTR